MAKATVEGLPLAQRVETKPERRPEPEAPSLLDRLLSNPAALNDLPVDKLAAMLAMQERMQAAAAKREYFAAMSDCQAEVGKLDIVRKGWNSHTRSWFALAADVERAIVPVITRHGFSVQVSQQDSPTVGMLRVRMIVGHAGGHSVEHWIDSPPDHLGPQGKAAKTIVHGIASTITYFTRHLLCRVFGVTTYRDDDGNAAAGVGPAGMATPITKAQHDELSTLGTKVGVGWDAMYAHFGIANLAELPANRYAEAKIGLEGMLKP